MAPLITFLRERIDATHSRDYTYPFQTSLPLTKKIRIPQDHKLVSIAAAGVRCETVTAAADGSPEQK